MFEKWRARIERNRLEKQLAFQKRKLDDAKIRLKVAQDAIKTGPGNPQLSRLQLAEQQAERDRRDAETEIAQIQQRLERPVVLPVQTEGGNNWGPWLAVLAIVVLGIIFFWPHKVTAVLPLIRQNASNPAASSTQVVDPSANQPLTNQDLREMADRIKRIDENTIHTKAVAERTEANTKKVVAWIGDCPSPCQGNKPVRLVVPHPTPAHPPAPHPAVHSPAPTPPTVNVPAPPQTVCPCPPPAPPAQAEVHNEVKEAPPTDCDTAMRYHLEVHLYCAPEPLRPSAPPENQCSSSFLRSCR